MSPAGSRSASASSSAFATWPTRARRSRSTASGAGCTSPPSAAAFTSSWSRWRTPWPGRWPPSAASTPTATSRCSWRPRPPRASTWRPSTCTSTPAATWSASSTTASSASGPASGHRPGRRRSGPGAARRKVDAPTGGTLRRGAGRVAGEEHGYVRPGAPVGGSLAADAVADVARHFGPPPDVEPERCTDDAVGRLGDGGEADDGEQTDGGEPPPGAVQPLQPPFHEDPSPVVLQEEQGGQGGLGAAPGQHLGQRDRRPATAPQRHGRDSVPHEPTGVDQQVLDGE